MRPSTSSTCLRRVPGVGSVSNVGSRYYAMRIWVQPDKLADLGLTVKDLQSVLKDQNRESAAGVLGEAPIQGSTSRFRSRPRAVCRRSTSSSRSSCGPTPTGRSSG